jgi:hypothetical protein
MAPLLLSLALSSCDDATDDACEPSDEPTSLAVDNRSGNAIDQLVATPCDGSETYEITLPGGGIPFSEQATVELPGPGCWLLHWSGEGCRNDPPHRTATNVCPGEPYAWKVTIDGRVCESGW